MTNDEARLSNRCYSVWSRRSSLQSPSGDCSRRNVFRQIQQVVALIYIRLKGLLVISIIHRHSSIPVHGSDIQLSQTQSHKLLLLQVRKLKWLQIKFHSLIQFLFESAGEGDGDSLVQFEIDPGSDLVVGRRPTKFLLKFFDCLLPKTITLLRSYFGAKQAPRNLLDFGNLS